MQWDVGLGRSVAHSLLVSGGAALLATAFAAILSYGIFFAKVPLGRLVAAWVSSMLLIPVYVQATAWSAGFGIQGWFRLSQVDAAKVPWWGIASVIWIHAVASMPACFLIFSAGWQRIHDATLEQAWVEMGPRYVATRILPRRLIPWFAIALLWSFCMTQNDMVVTNLFQVPTLCESVYQQVQFGKLRSGPIATACLLSLILGTYTAIMLQRLLRQRPFQESVPRCRWNPLPARARGIERIVPLAVWSIFTITILLPWLGMLVRIGLESRTVDGRAHREWRWSTVMNSIGHVLDYRSELGWSSTLAVWTTLLTMGVAVALVLWIPLRRGSAWVVGCMVFLVALPGPIVNLSISWLLNTALPPSLQFLGEQTLLGPILALQSRCLPVAYLILWMAHTRFHAQHESILAMDRALSVVTRGWIWFRHARMAMAVSALACVMIAFGDLASYLLVQPPGVTTVAMRMFDLLHYGIRNREASLAFALSAIALVPSWWLARRIEPTA